MKFHQLAIGARFEFAGKQCVKTSPVMANDLDSGKPVFMKRSSVVLPEAENNKERDTNPGQSIPQLDEALTEFSQRCREIVQSLWPQAGEHELAELDRALEQARRQTLARFNEATQTGEV